MRGTSQRLFRRASSRLIAMIMASFSVVVLVAPSAHAAGTPQPTPRTAPRWDAWLCRPDTAPNACSTGMDLTVKGPGWFDEHVEHATAPVDPGVDCFYVYPTISYDFSVSASLNPAPELGAIARQQAARFGLTCRLYVPLYRQTTLLGLFLAPLDARIAAGETAYADISAAFASYLAHDNGGRGIVLLSHSQGTFQLRRLIAQTIDPDPVLRDRLVGAVLLGGNVVVAKGSDRGGDFANVPACTRRGEPGCVIAFSTFNQTPPPNANFGANPQPVPGSPGADRPRDELTVLCTNPASLHDNTTTTFNSIGQTEAFPGPIGFAIWFTYWGLVPTASTPWVQPRDRYQGRCETRNGATALYIDGIGDSIRLNAAPNDGWGLHLLDANVALGDLVGDIAAQRDAWLAAHR